jgi:hypothetical protein
MTTNVEDSAVLHKSILVECKVETAFDVWTAQLNTWWPKNHSISGNPATKVYMEKRVGGRLYERTPDGIEFDWGHISVWDPPRHLAYNWYLGSTLERPTRVDIFFIAQEKGQTQVKVEHRGPELIGEQWSRAVKGFDKSWDSVFAAFSRSIL